VSPIKIIATNKRAFHEFNVSDSYEAGIALTGTEVKSLRAGKINLTDGWVDIDGYVATLRDVHISPYSHGNIMNHPDKRPRLLLLNKKELAKLGQAIASKGMTVVPIKIYFKGQRIKVEIALAKGKKLYDKRETSKEKDANREMARALKPR
jgi:SsrA-binding protein